MICKYCDSLCQAVPGGVQCDECDRREREKSAKVVELAPLELSVPMTLKGREAEWLLKTANEMCMSPDKVLMQALRVYSAVREATKRGEPVQIGYPLPPKYDLSRFPKPEEP